MRFLATSLAGLLLALACSGARALPAGEPPDLDPGGDEISSGREAGDTPEYATRARAGIIAGVVLDVLGFTGVIAGSFIGLELDSEAVLWPTVYASGGSWVLGSILLSGGYTDRHRAHREAGLEPRSNPGVLSWIFTAASAAAYAGSVGAFVRRASAEEGDSFERNDNLLGSVFLLGLSCVAEGINLGVFRTLWRKELRRSASSAGVRLLVVPMVVASRVGGAPGSSITGVAWVGTF